MSLTVAKYDVHRILVDNESLADILFYDAFVRMKISRARLQRVNAPLVGFIGSSVQVEGAINLPVTTGTEPCQSTVKLNFLVVLVPSAYNGSLGRSGLNTFRAVVSTYHLLMRFPTSAGTGEVRGDRMVARQCYMESLQTTPRETLLIEMLDPRDEQRVKRAASTDELLQILFN